MIFFQRLILPAGLLEGLKHEENQFLTDKEKYQHMWKHLQPATDTGQSHHMMYTTFRTYRSHKGGFRTGKIFILTYTTRINMLNYILFKCFLCLYTQCLKAVYAKEGLSWISIIFCGYFGTKLLHDKGAAVLVQWWDSKIKILSWSTLKCLG